MSGLRSICLNDDEERLYIANSQRVTEMVVEFQMSEFYPAIFQDPNIQKQFHAKSELSTSERDLLKEK